MAPSKGEQQDDKRSTSRRNFLRMAGLVALSPEVYWEAQARAAQVSYTVSVRNYGAKGDGASDDTWPVVDALAQNPRAAVIVPAGTYIIRNPVYVQNFQGLMQCEPGARFLFTDNSRPGWSFQGGSGASIINFKCAWVVPGRRRLGDSAGLQLDQTTNTWVDGCVVENSNGAGITCWICDYPKLTNCLVQNTVSNGYFISDCLNPMVLNCTSANSGDDGLEFVSHVDRRFATGGYARNVKIVNSRTRGIAVNGQSWVEINGFSVNGTAAAGILCAMDPRFKTRVPEAVRFTNGVIQNAGRLQPAVGNQYGIEVSYAKSVTLSNITTTGSGHRGISVYAPSGTVVMRDIFVNSPQRDSGANLQAQNLHVDILRTDNTPSFGIYIANCSRVIGTRLEAVNASFHNPLCRAIWLENNESIDLRLLNVIDNRPNPTGYIVGVYGPQQGRITGVDSYIPNYGPVHLDLDGSPDVSVVR